MPATPGDVPHGQDVIYLNSRKRIPARLLSHPGLRHVTVVTEEAFAHWYGPPVDVRTVESIDDLTVVREVVRRVLAERPASLLVSPAEHGVAGAGFLRSYFGLPGTPHDVANGFANKLAMKTGLRDAGLPVGPFVPLFDLGGLSAAVEAVGPKAVLKAAFGTGGVNVVALDGAGDVDTFLSGAEAERLRRTGYPFLVERALPLQAEFHCDAVVHDGRTLFVAVSRYFDPLLGRIDDFTGSYFVAAGSEDQAAVSALHDRAVRALGLRAGVTHLEVFKVNGRYLVGEIAARPGGGGIPEAVELAYGVDLWEAFLRAELGLVPECDPHPAEGVLVNCDLPIRPGRITAMSSAADLERLPGVLHVRFLHHVGDLVEYHLYSSAATGIVFLRLASEDDVAAAVQAVKCAYVYAVDTPVEGA